MQELGSLCKGAKLNIRSLEFRSFAKRTQLKLN